MPGKNPIGADNQQESQKFIGWIVGFIDGEGCFSVSINKNPTMKSGWQIFPEFVVTQEEKSLTVLKKIRKFFGCGKIFVNRRYDDHHEPLYRYCVRSFKDLRDKIIPFFRQNLLQTAKRDDFNKFAQIVNWMENKEHLTENGRIKIAKLISTMNRKKPSRLLTPSETIRQTSP